MTAPSLPLAVIHPLCYLLSVAMVLAEAVAASVVLLPLQLAGRRMEDAARLHIPLAGC